MEKCKSPEAKKGLDFIVENRLFEDWDKVDVMNGITMHKHVFSPQVRVAANTGGNGIKNSSKLWLKHRLQMVTGLTVNTFMEILIYTEQP